MITATIRSSAISRLVCMLSVVLLLFLTGCSGLSEKRVGPPPSPEAARPLDGSPNSREVTENQDKRTSPPSVTSSEEEEDDLFFEEEGEEDDFFFEEEGEELETAPEPVIADPLYYFNKAMFHFNDKLYFWVLKPTAKGYRAVTPRIVRKGISNFFHNLTTPIRFVSSTLQGKIKGAGSELARFVVNSTAGFLGFGDPAQKYLGLAPSEEDLGQTLGTYGIGNGIYVVWPVFGPSTLRDTVGRVGDFFLNPVTYVEPNELSYGIKALDTVNATSFRIGDYEALKGAYLDPYERIKEFYIESRKSKIEK